MFNRQVLTAMVEKSFEQYTLKTDIKSLQKGGSNYKHTCHMIVMMVDNWQQNNPCPTRRTTENYINQLCKLFWWGCAVDETNEMMKEN